MNSLNPCLGSSSICLSKKLAGVFLMYKYEILALIKHSVFNDLLIHYILYKRYLIHMILKENHTTQDGKSEVLCCKLKSISWFFKNGNEIY